MQICAQQHSSTNKKAFSSEGVSRSGRFLFSLEITPLEIHHYLDPLIHLHSLLTPNPCLLSPPT